MNLENELSRSWSAFGSGQQVFHNNGRLEIDPPLLPQQEDMLPPLARGNPNSGNIDWNDPEQANKYGTDTISPASSTMREHGQNMLINLFTSMGTDQYRARDIAERIMGSANPLSSNGIGAADMAVIPGTIMGLDESLRHVDDAITGLQAGRDGAGTDLAFGLGMTILNALPIFGGAKTAAVRAVDHIAENPGKTVGALAAGTVAGATVAPTDAEGGILDKAARAVAAADKNVITNTFAGKSKAAKALQSGATEEVNRVRNLYPEGDGWAPLELNGVSYDAKKETFDTKWKQPAYDFHKPQEGFTKETWRTEMTNRVVSDVQDVVQRAAQGDEQAKFILSQATWYRDMRNRLRNEFGGMADLFADLLGTTSAQTNVRLNWDNAVEIMRRFSRGEYDAEIANFERAIANGEDPNKVFAGIRRGYENASSLETGARYTEDEALALALKDYPMLTKAAGTLFGTNSPTSTGALIDTFRQIKAGASPKTPNFTGNLIGYTNEATIDVWAARYLTDLAGLPRIPPPAEKAVGGKHLTGSTIDNPRVGGEFGFGQDVFRSASEEINAKNIIPGETVGPDDLQAVAWFIEKEKWTKEGWTNKLGEGGSLDFEANRAGTSNPQRLAELRTVINSSKSTPEQVAAAQKEFDQLAAPVDRHVLGISGERPDRPMSNYAQAELASEFDDVLRGDKSVVAYKANNTYGRFMKSDERALDVEMVVRKDFNPEALDKRLVEMGKQYDQDAVFRSKVLRDDNHPNARPGVEVYFSNKQSAERLRQITDLLNERGIDGFTFVTDARQADRVNVQARAGGPDTAGLTGIRFQYIPEFDESFDPKRAKEIYKERAQQFTDVLNDIYKQGDVSSAQVVWYDTKVIFKDKYDEYLNSAGAASKRRGEARQGQSSGENAAGADLSGSAGSDGPGALPDGKRGTAKGSAR